MQQRTENTTVADHLHIYKVSPATAAVAAEVVDKAYVESKKMYLELYAKNVPQVLLFPPLTGA